MKVIIKTVIVIDDNEHVIKESDFSESVQEGINDNFISKNPTVDELIEWCYYFG